VDIDNLVEPILVFGEETSTNDEVALLEPTNPCEKLPKRKFDMVAISFVNDLKALSDYVLSSNEDDGHLSISHELF
jgi:hypothetical protein